MSNPSESMAGANDETLQQMMSALKIQSVPNFGEFIGLIPTFSGENPNVSIHDFFDRVQEVSKFAGWTDEQILFVCKMKLCASADKFLRSQPQIKGSFILNDFKQAMLDRFSIAPSEKNYLLQFTSAIQGEEEATRAFLTRVLGLSHKCFPADEETRNRMVVHQSLTGLRPAIRRFVMAQSPSTFEDIWRLALKEEECSALEASSAHVNIGIKDNASSVESELKEIKALMQCALIESDNKIKDLAEEVKRLQRQINEERNPPNKGQSSNRAVICYNCNKPGHFSRDCWFPRRQRAPPQNFASQANSNFREGHLNG